MSKNSPFFALILLVCGACSAESAGMWGEPTLIARAPQAAPPGFALLDDEPLFSWVGVDERGVHHDARALSGEGITLPLPPTQPRDQRLVAGIDDRAHLFWLDADEDGVTQLYSALIDSNLQIERGPTQISDGLVLDYALAEDASGGVFVAYSGSTPGEPSLTLTGVDTQGRPLPVFDRIRAAEIPTFLWIGGDLRLYWVNRDSAMLMGGTLQAGHIRDVRSLLPTRFLDAGDNLMDVRAGADRTHVYLFWNMERATGIFETWYTFATLNDDDRWASWVRVGSRIDDEALRESGYNSGVLQPATADAAPLYLVAPVSQQGATLPVIGVRGTTLVVVYLRGGESVGEQVLVNDVTLLTPPLFVGDQSRHLYAVWSEVGTGGSADLYFLSSLSRR